MATLSFEIAVCLALFIVVYTYLLYPFVLFGIYCVVQTWRDLRYVISRRDRRVRDREADLPAVTLVVAAYNEEHRLEAKLKNLGELAYPADRLKALFVSDGSTDRTNEILRAVTDPRVRALFVEPRQGKVNALNCAVEAADTEVLLFSDAATLLDRDAVRKLVRHLSDPKVGAACGALRFEGTAESQQTEGKFWGFESVLRLMEARLGATLTASGALYALRRCCYEPLPARTMIEDFLIPMNARKKGYSVVYDPEATALEFAADSVQGEFTRRVRLAVGSFRALPELLKIPMNVMTAFAFVSHKLLRWLVPFLLIVLLVGSGVLWSHLAFRALFIAQALFYLWALLGYIGREKLRRVRYALVGYFVLAMNLAFIVGFYRFLFREEEATWQRVN